MRLELRAAGTGAAVFLVELGDEIELSALLRRRCGIVADVLDKFFYLGVLGVDESPLVDAGEESGLPVLRVFDRVAARAHGDEGR